MQKLPERCREVFILSRLKGLKNREISETLQISTTAVEKHLAKALRILTEELKDRYTPALITWILTSEIHKLI